MDDVSDQKPPVVAAPVDPATDLAQLTKYPAPTLAEEVEEFEEKQHDFQAMYQAGGPFKEQLEALASQWAKERSAPVERPVRKVEVVPTAVEMEKHPEVTGYVERVEKEAELAQPVVDDYTQQVLVSSAAPQSPTVTLPLTQDQVEKGLQRRVWESLRWLAEWCVRQIKLVGSRARYKSA